MNKKEFAEEMARNLSKTKSECENILDLFLDIIKEQVAHQNEVSFQNFGVFRLKTAPERMYRNPKTGQKVKKGQRYGLRFKPAKAMCDVSLIEKDMPKESLPVAK